jgi:hypothetical protein
VIPVTAFRNACTDTERKFPKESCQIGATTVLTLIKVLHTAVWGLLAGCILALPIVAFFRRFEWALLITALIIIECGVLALNRGRCPLTDLAARYTGERSDNFDIYLPNWLARYNKKIFGTLFVVNELIVLWYRFART